MLSDVRRISGPMLSREAGLAPGQLDLLTGCPPCQGFSSLQTRKTSIRDEDPRNELIFETLRLVRSIRPRALIVENVPGLACNWRFQTLLQGLTNVGYAHAHAVLNAADFGVPQRRHRLVLVALRDQSVPKRWCIARNSRQTVRDAIAHLATSLERRATSAIVMANFSGLSNGRRVAFRGPRRSITSLVSTGRIRDSS